MVILKKLQKQHKALGDALVHIETLEDAEALTTMEDKVNKFNEDAQVVKRKIHAMSQFTSTLSA